MSTFQCLARMYFVLSGCLDPPYKCRVCQILCSAVLNLKFSFNFDSFKCFYIRMNLTIIEGND